MSDWHMLTLVGEDRPGIVARVTDALFRAGCTLGEASMLRLGSNFTIMLMVTDGGGARHLETALGPAARELGLRFHVDPIAGGLHRHLVPNVQVRVNGADRPGIVAQVTGVLAGSGFNILELESDVAGDAGAPVYIMNIQGYSEATVETLQAALATLAGQGIDVDVCPIETLIG
jgi:glycine cleavage system transcriptional repressor